VVLPQIDGDAGTLWGRLFVVGESDLQWTSITADGSVNPDGWEQLSSKSYSPKWGQNVRLSAVQTSAWPAPSIQDVYELVLLDESGELWQGKADLAGVQWRSLALSNDQISSDVRPAALRADDDVLYVLTATANDKLDIRELSNCATTSIGQSESLAIIKGSAISAALKGDLPYIISVVDVEQANSRSSAVLNGTSIVDFVKSAEKASGTKTKTAWLNRKEDGVLSLFVTGTRETTCMRDLDLALVRKIEALQDVLVLEGADEAADYALLPDRVEDRLIELNKDAFDDHEADESIYAIDQSHKLEKDEPH